MGSPSLLPVLAAALLGQHVAVVPLDALAPPPEVEEAPPVEALVDSVLVVVDPGEETGVEMSWSLRAITPGWVDLPLTGGALAVERATLDGEPIAADPGPDGVRRLTVFLDGRHRLALHGSVVTPEATLSLPLLTAARAAVEVRGGPWDVEVEDAVVSSGDRFDLVQTERLALAWRPAAPPAPRPTVISTEGAVAYSVDEAGIQGHATLRYRIRHGAVETVRFGLPGAVEDLAIEGAGVLSHARTGDTVEVRFSRPVEGSVILDATFRCPPPEGDDLAALPVPWSSESKDLWVSVLRGDESMVVPEPASGLDPVAAADLPGWAAGLAAGEEVASYRATGVTPALGVRALRYEPVEEPPTLVDEARYEVAYTTHGRVLLRARYQVRNDRNQYLHVMPPAGYEPIGARVAGVVAQPAADGAGGLYVPLEKSVETLEGLVSFPVEVLFWGEEAGWDDRGTRTLTAPAVDAPIAYARWEIVLPPDREAKAAVSDATLVERWTDRDKGLTYGKAYGEGLREEEGDRIVADSKDKAKRIQVVQRSRRGPPAPPPPAPMKKKNGKSGRRTGLLLGGGAASPPQPKADEQPAPEVVAGQLTSEEQKELQEDLSMEVFNQAYAAYKSNMFVEADQLLEKSLELDPSNFAAEALQSNVDVFVGKGEATGEAGEEEVMSRRVRELAQAKTQGQRVAQEKLKQEAEQAFRAGDIEAAHRQYRQLVEVTEELAQVEQVEKREQKAQLESFQRQLVDLERQVDETKKKAGESKARLILLEEHAIEGRDGWGDDAAVEGEIEGGVVGGVEGGVVGGVVGGVLGGVATPDEGQYWTDETLAGSTSSSSEYGVEGAGFRETTTYHFEDDDVSGELVRPQGLDEGRRDTGEDLDGFQDEDGIPDPDIDGDGVVDIDVDQTVSGTTMSYEFATTPDPAYLLDRATVHMDSLIEHREDFDDIELAPGTVAIVLEPAELEVQSAPEARWYAETVVEEEDEEDEFSADHDWKPPVEPLVDQIRSSASADRPRASRRGGRGAGFGGGGLGGGKRKRTRAVSNLDAVAPAAAPPTDPAPVVQLDGRARGEARNLDLPPSKPVVAVTASALSIRVPRAGESLRFEQRLIPENTPLTVELRYRTPRGPSDRRNR